MIRAGHSLSVRRAAGAQSSTRPKKHFCVLAPSLDIFRTRIVERGAGGFSGRSYVTDDVVYRYCREKSDVLGIKFTGVLMMGRWLENPGHEARQEIFQYVRSRGGASLEEIRI